MQFKLALLAVKDVEASKKFYTGLFEQSIVSDFGWNVTFSGGFAIQQEFAWLTGLKKEEILPKSNNMELYFEVDDFDDFLKRLEKYPEIEFLNKPMKHDWQQRVVRIYDPDYHIIEIGESMEIVVLNCLKEGKSLEETTKITMHPAEFIKMAATKHGYQIKTDELL